MSEWQPMEPLPRAYRTVLTCLGNAAIATGFVDDTGRWHVDGWDRAIPINWMPLPAPPPAPSEALTAAQGKDK